MCIQPKRCIICANPSHTWACKSCTIKRPYFDETRCVADFDSRLQLPVLQLRDHSKLNVLAGLLEAWQTIHPEQYISPQLIIPAPSTTQSIRHRGFSPAWEIAKRIAKTKKIPTCPNLIHYKNQTLSIPRIRGMRFDYIYKNLSLNQLNAQLLSGINHVAVIDDFMHTGETLNAVAGHLKENGVHRVSNWVLLRISHWESN